MPDTLAPESWNPIAAASQPLTPHDSFREMASEICNTSQVAFDFLMKCQACGLPVDERLAELRQHVEFCRNFLRHFYQIGDL